MAWLFNADDVAPATPTLITGFTDIASTNDVDFGAAGLTDERVCYRIATGSEGPTYASTAGGGVYSLGKLLRITGAHRDNPINATGFSSTAGATTLALPSVTTTVTDCLAIAFVQTGLVDISATPPTGWTLYERWNSNELRRVLQGNADGGGHRHKHGIIRRIGRGHRPRCGHRSPGAAATVPDTVTTLAATPGNTQVALTWTAPADGGAAITSYDYRVNGGTWTTTGSASPGYTVTGLTNGVSYNSRSGQSTASVPPPHRTLSQRLRPPVLRRPPRRNRRCGSATSLR